MSVERLKNNIVQLERKRNKRRLAVNKLQDEHDQLLLHSRAMDLLVQHQDTVTRMLHGYFQPHAEPLPSIADDTGFIQPVLYKWPLMAEFQAMRLADYNWLLGASVLQVRFKVLEHLQDIALLMGSRRNNHSSNSCSIPFTLTAGDNINGNSSSSNDAQQAALDRAVSELLHLTKAMYIITPQLVYQLKDMNLLTGQLDPPPDSHWERAFCATEASLDQLAVMQQILQHIMPVMEQLEQERLELAACINSVKALSLHEQSAQAKAAAQLVLQQQQQQVVLAEQQQQEQEQQPQGRLGASRAAGKRAAAVRRVSAAVAATRRASRAQKGAAAAAAAAGRRGRGRAAAVSQSPEKQPTPAGYYMSLLQEALAAEDPAAAPAAPATTAAPPPANAGTTAASAATSNSNSAAVTGSSSTSSAAKYMRGMCKDMVADMDARLLRWRTLSGARSAVSFVFRSEQLASLLLACFPYLPMTACMCDYVPAARAAAVQREQRQQQMQATIAATPAADPAAAAAGAAADQVMS